jgi:hypothetical protein
MNINLDSFIFFDIETVPVAPSFNEASDEIQTAFTDFCLKRYLKDDPLLNIIELFDQKAALIPEFADIVCISIGRIIDGEYKIVRLINEDDDCTDILMKFAKYLNKNLNVWLCGYNIVNFDIPFIVKQMIKHNIKVPKILNTYFSKPWERTIFDIFDFWRNFRYDYMPSLLMVCSFLNCGNPKENISGADVGNYYWGKINGVSRDEAKKIISDYCNNDVIATMKILEKLKASECI